MDDPNSKAEQTGASRLSAQAQLQRAGEGVMNPEDHGVGGLGGGLSSSPTRPISPAKFTAFHSLRADLDARQSEHAPQCLLPRRQGVPLAPFSSPHSTRRRTELWIGWIPNADHRH